MRVAQANTGGELPRQAAPDLYAGFAQIRRALARSSTAKGAGSVYRQRRPVSFSPVPLLHSSGVSWLGPVWFSAHALLLLGSEGSNVAR